MKLETMVLGPLETNCYLLWDEQTMEAAVIDPGASGQKIGRPSGAERPDAADDPADARAL